MTGPLEDPRVARGMEAQLAARRELLAGGEQPLGWKVGFGAPAAMEKLGTQAPLVGFLLESGSIPSGSSVSIDGWTSPALEPEIAAYVGSDLAAGADRASAQEAIAAVGPAFELADVDPPPEQVEEILAGNIFQRRVILGARAQRRSLDGVTATIVMNGGAPISVDDPQAITGELVDLVRHVADVLGACGERLRAGDVVIGGSIAPPITVAAGAEVEYELQPLGEISVRFS